MYERFEELCRKNVVTPYQVSKATGVSQSVLSDWKHGKSRPKQDKMKLIAMYFCVSVDYLMGNDETTMVIDTSSMDERQVAQIRKILTYFNAFNELKRKEIEDYAEYLASKDE